jgi:hypothetical protein
MKLCLRIVTVCAALAVFAATAITEEKKDPAVSEVVAKRLGEKTVGILQGADRVEVFRINPEKEGKEAGKNRIGGYAVTATGKEQDKVFAGKLAGVLLQGRTYSGQSFKCFDPGVAYRIWKGKESVEVAICFACENLRIGDAFGSFGGAKGNWAAMVKVAKEAFPDDKEIQGLPEKDRRDK